MTSSQLITTAFTATSTAADVLEGVDLTGLRAIVTGASSGIGVETARALAAAGAEMTLAARNTTAGVGIADMIEMNGGRSRPHVARLDLADQASVHQFVDGWDGSLAEAAGVFTYKTIEQGAANSVIAAVAPEFAHTGGHYLDDAQEAYTVPNNAELAQHPHGVKEWALDPAAAEHLWKISSRHLHG